MKYLGRQILFKKNTVYTIGLDHHHIYHDVSYVSFVICFILPAQVGGLPAPQPGDMQLMPSLVYGQIFFMHNGDNWLQGRQCQHTGTVQDELELQGRGEAACPTSS